MTNEVVILRAYALLSQGECDAALEMFRGAPKALNTLSGADLFARIRFEQGFEVEARQIWERIHAAAPDFEPAAKALDAFRKAPCEVEDEERVPRGGVWIVVCVALFLGIGGVVWGLCRKPETVVQVCEMVQTNVVERVVEVPVETCVTAMVERVCFVTNTLEVVRRVVETNTIERVVTNTIEKVVYKEEQGDGAEKPAPKVSRMGKVPRGGVMPKRFMPESAARKFDRAVMDGCRQLGLIPSGPKIPLQEGE